MWNSFIRAWFIFGIILGFEEVCLSAYWFWKKNRVMGWRWLLRGISFLIIHSFGLWWLVRRNPDVWNDLRFLLLFFAPLVITMGVEAVVRVRIERKKLGTMFSEQPQQEQRPWAEIRRRGRMRFIGTYVLAFTLSVIMPAIVFSFISPELLKPYWWVAIVLVVASIGFLIGHRQWTINEKQWNSRSAQM